MRHSFFEYDRHNAHISWNFLALDDNWKNLNSTYVVGLLLADGELKDIYDFHVHFIPPTKIRIASKIHSAGFLLHHL
jgi:hypothetical protein